MDPELVRELRRFVLALAADDPTHRRACNQFAAYLERRSNLTCDASVTDDASDQKRSRVARSN